MPVQEGLRWVRIQSLFNGSCFIKWECNYNLDLLSLSVMVNRKRHSYTQQSRATMLISLLILLAKSSSQLALHAHTSKHGVSRAAEVRLYGKWFLIKDVFYESILFQRHPLFFERTTSLVTMEEKTGAEVRPSGWYNLGAILFFVTLRRSRPLMPSSCHSN